MTISEPNSQFAFDITFSKTVRMPANITMWQDDNEGTDKLLLEYRPSEDTQTVMYD